MICNYLLKSLFGSRQYCNNNNNNILVVQIFQTCDNIFGTCWQQVCRRRSQSRRLRNGQNLLECKDFLQLQTGENRSKNTPSLLKIQGTGLCSCGLLYCSTVRLLSRNRISSQWILFLATTFSGLSFVFC